MRPSCGVQAPLPSCNESRRLFRLSRPLWRSFRRCRCPRSVVEPLLRFRRQPRRLRRAKARDWRQWHLAVGFLPSPRASSPFLLIFPVLRRSLSARTTASSSMRPTTWKIQVPSTTMACFSTRRLGTMAPLVSRSVAFHTARRSLTRSTSPTRASGALTGFTHTPRCDCVVCEARFLSDCIHRANTPTVSALPL
jgi:hypothetical protein